jgi:Domain of unknown function (DUF1707)/2TM domain
MDQEPRGVDRHASLRASDADRERTVAQLRQHHGDGRLTLDEFDERMNQAYAARTLGELDRLLTDLPPVAVSPPVPSAARPPVPLQARRDFYRHLCSYVATNAFLVVIWALTGTRSGFWPIWVIAFWGMAVASHAARVFLFREEFGDRQRRHADRRHHRHRDHRSW